MTNNINFENVKAGEYTHMRYEAFDNIDMGIRKLKNGKYSVLFHQVTNTIKLKRLGYKLRCDELVVNNETELIEILLKDLLCTLTEMKVIIN